MPETPGYRLDEMIHGLHDGRVRALYLIGENPVQSDPDAHRVKEGFAGIEFLVSQDIFLNETSRDHADVVFPASSFAEKDGTFTNTERRVSRVRTAVACPGNARVDREIVIDLARALGADWPEYPDAESVWNELADLAPPWSGIRYDRLEQNGLQWPCPDRDHPGSPFLHEGGPALGKGVFHAVEYLPPVEQPDDEFPFVLSTGRTLYHYNTATMTMREGGILAKQEDPFFEIHPSDAAALGLESGDWARLVSRRGELEARAASRRARVPGPRLDGAPFHRIRSQLAHDRRSRSPHGHARVQGVRGAGRKDIPCLSTLTSHPGRSR